MDSCKPDSVPEACPVELTNSHVSAFGKVVHNSCICSCFLPLFDFGIQTYFFIFSKDNHCFSINDFL
jgi:hypothetical protein